jgi:hypothetical protein
MQQVRRIKGMDVKYPIEYELSPESVDEGTHSVAIKLRNIGKEDLIYVKVDLNSLDSHSLLVMGTYKTIPEIRQNETEDISFELDVKRTTDVYIILTATKGLGSFYWESPPMPLIVGKEKAKLESLFVLAHPYLSIGSTADVEAIVQGLENSYGMRLEFWVETPKGVSEELARIELNELSNGQEAQYSTKVTFKEKGLHTVHAYLYDRDKRTDYKSDTVLVK